MQGDTTVIIECETLRSFVELVTNGTYNYCREALEIKAKDLLENLKNKL